MSPARHWFRFVVIFLFLTCLLSPTAQGAMRTPPWERGKSNAEDLKISLYSFGPGTSLEEWWGHVALGIADTRRGDEVLYNWGMFSFDTDLVKGFATGRLRFWVDADPVPPVVAFYRRFGRSIRVYDLNLSPEKRLQLAELVTENLQLENREYDYEYFKDNCATRIRDLLDTVLDGQLAQVTTRQPARMTVRDHVDILTASNPPMALLLGFLLNGSIDTPTSVWNEMFLPGELARAIAPVRYTDAQGKSVPLVTRETEISPGNPHLKPTPPPKFFPWDLCAGLVLGLLPFVPRFKKQGLAASALLLGLLVGLPGAVLFIFNVASHHTYTYWNANLLLGNPLTPILLFVGPVAAFRPRSRAARAATIVAASLALLAFVALALEVVPAWGYQRNGEYLRLITPWILGLAVGFALNLKPERRTRP